MQRIFLERNSRNDKFRKDWEEKLHNENTVALDEAQRVLYYYTQVCNLKCANICRFGH